jgi:hypothetical protein
MQATGERYNDHVDPFKIVKGFLFVRHRGGVKALGGLKLPGLGLNRINRGLSLGKHKKPVVRVATMIEMRPYWIEPSMCKSRRIVWVKQGVLADTRPGHGCSTCLRTLSADTTTSV